MFLGIIHRLLLDLLVFKKVMFEGALHCSHDAEMIWLIYRSPEKGFQVVDLFANCRFLKTVELDPVS
jgi:hypothetical protein